MVICLERGADLHVAQLMPLPLTVSCFSKIQIGFTFLVPAHPGSPGQIPLNGCVCVCVLLVISIRFRYLDHLVANRMAPSMCLDPCGTRWGSWFQAILYHTSAAYLVFMWSAYFLKCHIKLTWLSIQHGCM